MAEARVYITNVSGHDYSSAAEFGVIKPITVGYVSFGNLDRLKVLIAEGIMDSTSEDWLCLSGMSFLAVLTAVMWYDRHGVVKLLKWDEKGRGRAGNRYRPCIIEKAGTDFLFKELENIDGASSGPQERRVES